MSAYYFVRTVEGSMEEVEERTRSALQREGFGVLTLIDVQETLKNKLGVDFKPYRILGACNPEFAYKALSLEERIGTMLPCNVVLQSQSEGSVEVATVDPIASMQSVGNKSLESIAEEVRTRLQRVIADL